MAKDAGRCGRVSTSVPAFQILLLLFPEPTHILDKHFLNNMLGKKNMGVLGLGF